MQNLLLASLTQEVWSVVGCVPDQRCLRRALSSVAACGNKVDPVYETLRFGTSLAQRTKKSSSGSGSDSPHRTSVIASSPLAEPAVVPGRADLEQLRAHQQGRPRESRSLRRGLQVPWGTEG